MTMVKICGLSEIEHVTASIEAGVDFIGFVFAESRRRVTPETAGNLTKAIMKRNHRPETVGVFANSPIETVNSVAECCKLDRVQLSGNETWQYCLQIKKPIIKVFHITYDTTINKVISDIEEGNRLLKNRNLIFLLDSKTGNQYGGTGRTFDWKVAKDIAAHFPIIVAGGLDPHNVTTLVNEVFPWGVDVSSGVETEGKKDPVKIKGFVRAVRQAESYFINGQKQ
jgi:phosphoribosylanthranilate isomerase